MQNLRGVPMCQTKFPKMGPVTKVVTNIVTNIPPYFVTPLDGTLSYTGGP